MNDENYDKLFNELPADKKRFVRNLLRKAVMIDDARVISSAFNMAAISQYYYEDRTEQKFQAWQDIMRRSGDWMPVASYPDFGQSMRGIIDSSRSGYVGLMNRAFDLALSDRGMSSLTIPSIILNSAASLLPPAIGAAATALAGSLDLIETGDGRISMGRLDESLPLWSWMVLATAMQADRDPKFNHALVGKLNQKLSLSALDILPDDEGTIENKDELARLRALIDGISAKIEAGDSDSEDIKKNIQELGDNYKAIITSLAEKQKFEKTRDADLKKYQYIRGEVAGFMSLVGILIKDPEQKRKFTAVSNAMMTSMDLARATKLYMDGAGTMGPLALASGWVGVGMIVLSTFSKSQEPQDIKLLKAIYEEVVALREEVQAGFDLIDKQLSSLNVAINLATTQNQINFNNINDSLRDLKNRIDGVVLEVKFAHRTMDQSSLDDYFESLKTELWKIDRRAKDRLGRSKSVSEYKQSLREYFADLAHHVSLQLVSLKDARVVLPASARTAIAEFNMLPGDRRVLSFLGSHMLWNFSLLLYSENQGVKQNISEGHTIITFPVSNPYLWASYAREISGRLSCDPLLAGEFKNTLLQLLSAGRNANAMLKSMCGKKATDESFKRFGDTVSSVYQSALHLVNYYDLRLQGPDGTVSEAWHAVRGRWAGRLTSGIKRPMRKEIARSHVLYFNDELTCRRHADPMVVAPRRIIDGSYYFQVSQFEDLVGPRIRDLDRDLRRSGYGELYIVADSVRIVINYVKAATDAVKKARTDGILGDGLAYYPQPYSFKYRIVIGRPLPIYSSELTKLKDVVMTQRLILRAQDGIDQDPIPITRDDFAEDRVDLPIIQGESKWLLKVKQPFTDSNVASMIFHALKKLEGNFNLSENMERFVGLQISILGNQEVFYRKLTDIISAGTTSDLEPRATEMMDEESNRLARELLQATIESRQTFDEFRARSMPEMERGGAASEHLVALCGMFSEEKIVKPDLTKLEDEAARILALDHGYIMAFQDIPEDFLTSLTEASLPHWFAGLMDSGSPRFDDVPLVLSSLRQLEEILSVSGPYPQT